MQKITSIGTKRIMERHTIDRDYELVISAFMQKAVFDGARHMADAKGGEDYRLYASEIVHAAIRMAALFNAPNPNNTLDEKGDEWRSQNGDIVKELYIQFCKSLAELERDKPGEIMRIILSANGESDTRYGVEIANMKN